MAVEVEECSSGGGCCEVRRDGSGVEGRQKIAKAIWPFHPPVSSRVFDAVLKHRWPSAPCHGANMAGGGEQLNSYGPL